MGTHGSWVSSGEEGATAHLLVLPAAPSQWEHPLFVLGFSGRRGPTATFQWDQTGCLIPLSSLALWGQLLPTYQLPVANYPIEMRHQASFLPFVHKAEMSQGREKYIKSDVQNDTGLICSFKGQGLLWERGGSYQRHFKHLHNCLYNLGFGARLVLITLLLGHCKPFFSFCNSIWYLHLDVKTHSPFFRLLSS